MAYPEYEQLAHQHGFRTFDDLLAASFKLPMTDSDVRQSYVAKRSDGQWFVWLLPNIRETRSCERTD